ncbi:hypothetical protein D9599_25785 [Roseomonas sp. KE2513]|uniref:hypothetical protein n=1 Tax=Roseomonas sp. KE2513 TaxID=2479202 RepID=UPI0018DFE2A1|nr:hypothetical protein [Roseomonas sp. KE2513]MBI0538969.1 hypothetical protein [Roseomonas sp. KE2513]
MSLEAEREALALLRAIRGELDTGTEHLQAIREGCDRIVVSMAGIDGRLELMEERVDRIAARLDEEASA